VKLLNLPRHECRDLFGLINELRQRRLPGSYLKRAEDTPTSSASCLKLNGNPRKGDADTNMGNFVSFDTEIVKGGRC
jgi:hypothetical protein